MWRVPSKKKQVFLTFDDGPVGIATDFVLQTLKEFKVPATFFCLGQQVEAYPSLTQRIIAEGHLLGNHGYHHLDGWKISKQVYQDNLTKGNHAIRSVSGQDSLRFRAPYGHFRGRTSSVMWSLMSGDFDLQLTKEKCLNRLISLTRSGDIIVFHDHEKSHEKLKWVLPKYLKYCIDQGFQFELLPQEK
ncbi:polysaccharide deacetylase family protein [Reichenbachiella carrageenanivorans]|uniref:Polysaccharide deacetylase family protein n=1 Tax=Reichenbachiella carrageenanivorans TaxID=2979869 RepID=A0ABY6CYA7_9BACT|nr:polysaccharide deacetylase family protein [Reichenbachiella carrageenanivorans]UXX78892.1 polysaccharide deacetylase family protein [Reichenbachiella carrageenanivorans]